jgi:hypothetical protein
MGAKVWLSAEAEVWHGEAMELGCCGRKQAARESGAQEAGGIGSRRRRAGDKAGESGSRGGCVHGARRGCDVPDGSGTLRRPVEQVPCLLREVQGARRRREVQGHGGGGRCWAARRRREVQGARQRRKMPQHAGGGRCRGAPTVGDPGARRWREVLGVRRRWEVQGHAVVGCRANGRRWRVRGGFVWVSGSGGLDRVASI